MPQSIARSSTGHCVFDNRTGHVIHNATTYDISHFDVEEWYEHYRESSMPEEIDILDLGYWEASKEVAGQKVYESPAYDWRAERKAMIETGDVYGVLGFANQDFIVAGTSVGSLKTNGE